MCTICFTDHNSSHLQALFADMWSWSMLHTLKTMIKKISKPYSLNTATITMTLPECTSATSGFVLTVVLGKPVCHF